MVTREVVVPREMAQTAKVVHLGGVAIRGAGADTQETVSGVDFVLTASGVDVVTASGVDVVTASGVDVVTVFCVAVVTAAGVAGSLAGLPLDTGAVGTGLRLELTAELLKIILHNMSRLVGKPTMWFSNRSDTNRPVQLQKQARSLKFWS